MDSAFDWLQSLTPYLIYAHLVVVVIAWTIAAVIAFTSVCPESIRPHLAEPEVERFGAYFLAGVVFVLAYPGYILYVAVGIIIAAFALEGVQYILPEPLRLPSRCAAWRLWRVSWGRSSRGRLPVCHPQRPLPGIEHSYVGLLTLVLSLDGTALHAGASRLIGRDPLKKS